MSAHRKTDVRRCKITSDFSLQGESAPGSYGPCFWAIPKYKKQQKNTDLWEENCHSGPNEKAAAIFIPLPRGLNFTIEQSDRRNRNTPSGSSKRAEVMRRPLGPPQRRGHTRPRASRGHQGSCSGKARKASKAEKFFLAETVEFFSLRSCPNCSAPAASGLHPMRRGVSRVHTSLLAPAFQPLSPPQLSQHLRLSAFLKASSLSLRLLRCYEVWFSLKKYCRVTTSSELRHHLVALAAIPLIA